MSGNEAGERGSLTLGRAAWMGVAVTWTVVALLGCNQIAGIEKRVDNGENDQFNTVDKETDLFTTELCVEYCDAVMGNCEEFPQYAARGSCINSCNAMPPGDPNEPEGHNVECRLRHANNAANAPDEECSSAGPTGGNGACGSSCEAWCQMLESECPEDHALLNDCKSTCDTIENAGGFDVEANYTGDTVQCRLIHLGAVGEDKQESPHCAHARYAAADKCIPEEDSEPKCADYCRINLAQCQDENAVYDSEEECMETCAAFPAGEHTDTTENTIGCRIYHSKNAASSPQVHCKHGGPSGDGHCGLDNKDDETTGNCESYCLLYSEACEAEYRREGYEDQQDCVLSCSEQFAKKGAAAEAGYSVDTASEEDSLQCRIAGAARLLGGKKVSCDRVVPDGDCK